MVLLSFHIHPEAHPGPVAMDAQATGAVVIRLAGQANELASRLYSLDSDCGNETIVTDLSAIAGELAMLSKTLWDLTDELGLIFEEISECSNEIKKVEGARSAVSRVFKKGRSVWLQKHLEALKTTLIVMRTILHHGKDYGVHG